MLRGSRAEHASIMATVSRLVSRLAADELPEISEVADGVGLEPAEVEPYGRDKAKIDLSVLNRLAATPDGKLIAVTAVTPTKSGEGKTTTAISLTEGLGYIGARSLVCLREPSVGPTLGAKGGGTGAGRAQVVPGQDINLHFTGDLHAIAAANNLLASAVDAHLVHDNGLGINPATITWRRCLDIEDRLLRTIAVGVGEAEPFPRESGFDITAASEVMALLAMARDRDDLRRRLGAITVARTFDGEPVTADDLDVAGAMAVLLKDALKPNLVQTLEGQPALVHAGPFANIAHGNSSLVADLVGLKLADYVVTEGGFASDLGFEKFVHIVCRTGGLSPAAVVLVATTQALKLHGGDSDGGLPAIERGAENLAAHLRIVKELGFDAVVAVNRFPGDLQVEVEAISALALEHGAFGTAVNDAYETGGVGASAFAEVVVEAAARGGSAQFVYDLDDPVEAKIDALARRIYGGAGVELSEAARETLERLPAELHRVPVCVAKTHLSLSHDPQLVGAPRDFILPVRELRAYTGAGWLVAVCGETQTMPGLPPNSAAERMDLDAEGRIVGLA
jgi:formate--tetrahydrofolate ligase